MNGVGIGRPQPPKIVHRRDPECLGQSLCGRGYGRIYTERADTPANCRKCLSVAEARSALSRRTAQDEALCRDPEHRPGKVIGPIPVQPAPPIMFDPEPTDEQ